MPSLTFTPIESRTATPAAEELRSRSRIDCETPRTAVGSVAIRAYCLAEDHFSLDAVRA